MFAFIPRLFKRKHKDDYLYEVSKGYYYDSILIDLNTFFHQVTGTSEILHTNEPIVFNKINLGSFIPQIKKSSSTTWYEEKKLLNKKYEIAFSKSSFWRSKVRSQTHIYDNRFFMGSHIFYGNQEVILNRINKKYDIHLKKNIPAVIYDDHGNTMYVSFGTTLQVIYFEEAQFLVLALNNPYNCEAV